MGLRFLITRSHGYSPFFCLHGFEVDLPVVLQQDVMDLPKDMTDVDLITYAQNLA